MLGRLYESQNCSISRTLELVGERWSLLILRDAMFAGFTRFSQFQKSLGIATNVLTKRLEDFVEDGIMERRQETGGQAEYLLTRKGRELMPVLMAMTEWGDKWVRPGPIAMETRSHQPVQMQIRGRTGRTEFDVDDIVAVLR